MRFEIRVCDECYGTSPSRPAGSDELERLHGWSVTDGRDLCATCVWDTECAQGAPLVSLEQPRCSTNQPTEDAA